jgi:glycosyltransferase involved in cell wall biosynthesis
VPAEDNPALSISLVMPAYNEEGAIRDVVRAWDDELRAQGVPYELRVYNDGSRDSTRDILDAVARERPQVVAIHQENRGHGPTLLRAYREARGRWVFQVDSDDEMDPSAFPEVWKQREAALVIGYRVGRSAPLGRRIITAVSYWTVRLFFGAGIRDVNIPYRLYRREALARLLPLVPADAFAPNVILSGLVVRHRMRIAQVPVPFRTRRTGETHIVRWRMLRAAATSFAQTMGVALRARSS